MVVLPLKGYNSFDEILRSGRRVSSGPLLLTLNCEETASSYLYVGVAISKRVAKHAVVRNRIKRLLRVAARNAIREHQEQCQHVLAAQMILIWRKAPSHPMQIQLSDVQPYVSQALLKALTLCG